VAEAVKRPLSDPKGTGRERKTLDSPEISAVIRVLLRVGDWRRRSLIWSAARFPRSRIGELNAVELTVVDPGGRGFRTWSGADLASSAP
jgi:hypothetical protein